MTRAKLRGEVIAACQGCRPVERGGTFHQKGSKRLWFGELRLKKGKGDLPRKNSGGKERAARR